MLENMVISEVLAATETPLLGFITPKLLEIASLWFTLPNIYLHWSDSSLSWPWPADWSTGKYLVQREGLGVSERVAVEDFRDRSALSRDWRAS